MSKRKKQHGGTRAGAGAKPRYGKPMRPVSVTMTEAHIGAARAHGDGEVSEGLRRLVEEHLLDESP